MPHFKPSRFAARQGKKSTDWNEVSSWYDQLVGEKGSDYHQNVIIPGALRLLQPRAEEKVLDIACGQGVFSRELAKRGARVCGVDASGELIKLAVKRSKEFHRLRYFTADAEKLVMFNAGYFQAAACILAIQNIAGFDRAIGEAARVLEKNGRFLLVTNHPCFRIPRQSGWGFDEQRKLQYRRVDSYLTPQKIPIQMHPGYRPGVHTWTFHRSLTDYFRVLKANGFVVTELEEWTSHRESQPGARKKSEDRARKEIPLFMAILARSSS